MDYTEQVSQVISTARFGDLIEFSYPVGYSHWGVYDEDGYILHFAVADSSESDMKKWFRHYLQKIVPLSGDILLGATQIKRQLVAEVNVPSGAQVMISNNRHSLHPSPEQEIRLRAESLLDKELPYKLFTFNCEHFATFVRYGRAVCNQVGHTAQDSRERQKRRM
ncbi:phospholipase A and acyltransferase 2 isoform X2 [Amia ocellicauda]|uniref:phospholipase A and acyltransferase 2 isoform X2 n=1 Tax=Amia ocellicauda TaxID=2972642 RepID=UPI00346391EA